LANLDRLRQVLHFVSCV